MYKRISIVLFICLSLTFHSFAETQLDKWNAFALEVNGWGDGLGLPLDEGIKEVVIGLNLFQIITRQSCEGHLDWGRLYPWVDFQFDFNNTKFQEQRAQINEKIDSLEKILEEKYPQLSLREILELPEAEPLLQHYEERRLFWLNAEKEKLSCIKPLEDLLREFYRVHHCSYETMLIIKKMNDDDYWYELASYTSQWQISLTSEQKAEKLLEYQKEMTAFGHFLKQKFLNANESPKQTTEQAHQSTD